MKTGDKEEGSRAAGSPRPGCGRAGEPRSRTPGSARRAGRAVRSERSSTARPIGPVRGGKYMSFVQIHHNDDIIKK